LGVILQCARCQQTHQLLFLGHAGDGVFNVTLQFFLVGGSNHDNLSIAFNHLAYLQALTLYILVAVRNHHGGFIIYLKIIIYKSSLLILFLDILIIERCLFDRIQ
jgi:hypothetical protein